MAAFGKNRPHTFSGCKQGFLTLVCVSSILVVLFRINETSFQISFPVARCGGKTCSGGNYWAGENKIHNSTLSKEIASFERHRDLQYGNFVSAAGQSFQTWTNLSAPGTYRGCIYFVDSYGKFFNIVQEEDNPKMTVVRCLNQCNKKAHTYAGLLNGTQCHCINFTGPMEDSLHYVPTSDCCVPCSGDPSYNCGGRRDTFSLYRTKVSDSRCSQISLKPNGSIPLRALASFPRSGNTWTRRLLEHATGIFTGSIYWRHESQLSIGSNIFLGGNTPYNAGSTLCTKTHVFSEQKIKEFHDGAILLLRNSYKAIVAEAFRRYRGVSREGKKRATEFIKSKKWTDFVRKCATDWEATAINWCQYSKRLLVVYYEDLQKNTSKELMRMIEFLNQPLDLTRITCAVQELPSSLSTGVSLGNHGLQGRSYLTFDPFTKLMRRQIHRHISAVNSTLIRYRHSPLPNYEEVPALF
ncbi:WSC domain-containing protein 2 [Holothuria leucospilota]|uniref:WSC domain-containing protein 2 n=1 Tax=Holothuria leucospilota TaxID=206669 RepID=A0A9Q1C086_HOLLE|nr:WSC domain-containing protein 2 [Holothuria leucospilota]